MSYNLKKILQIKKYRKIENIELYRKYSKTKRHLMTRVKEHLEINKTTKSEVETHITNFLYCREHAKFDSFQVIKKCQTNFNTYCTIEKTP